MTDLIPDIDEAVFASSIRVRAILAADTDRIVPVRGLSAPAPVRHDVLTIPVDHSSPEYLAVAHERGWCHNSAPCPTCKAQDDAHALRLAIDAGLID